LRHYSIMVRYMSYTGKVDIYNPHEVIEVSFAGPASSGQELTQQVLELGPEEAIEIYRIEVIPAVDSSTKLYKKIKYVTILVGGNEYSSIRINSVMSPTEDPTLPPVKVNLGTPILHTPFIGRLPTAFEATCPKASHGDKVFVKLVPEDALASGDTVKIRLHYARVRGNSMLQKVVGTTAYTAPFILQSDTFTKTAPVTVEGFTQLPGGLMQTPPIVMPWITYARNNKATTPNTWFDFTYPDTVLYDFMQLSFNLVDKRTAYIVSKVGVIPNDANVKSLRFYIEGRPDLPEYPIRQDYNFFQPALIYDTTKIGSLKWLGPVDLSARNIMPAPGFLMYKGKYGIQVKDNGTSVAVNGVEIHVYGVLIQY